MTFQDQFQGDDQSEIGLSFLSRAAAAHLEDHLCAGHAFHHDLGVAGRCFTQHLGANGGQIQQDRLQGMSVEEELVG